MAKAEQKWGGSAMMKERTLGRDDQHKNLKSDPRKSLIRGKKKRWRGGNKKKRNSHSVRKKVLIRENGTQ